MGLLLLSSTPTPPGPSPGPGLPYPSSLVWDSGDFLYLYASTPLGHLAILQIPTADLDAYKTHVFPDEPYHLDGSQAPLVKGEELIFQLNHGSSRAIQKLCIFTERAEDT